MEFFDVLRKRRSVRAFRDAEIDDETLEKILEAANSAPSAGDLQAYEIVVVRSDRRKKEIAEAAYSQEFIREAPVVLVFLANPERSSWKYGKRGSELYCIQDATIAAAYTQLAVTSLGLGSVWVGAFDTDKLAEILRVEGEIPVAVIPVGYPAEEPMPTPRRKLEELVHRETLK
ncbi:MAG: nitroreductase family protein [Candidatus Hydrothermarchaeaceae archaeon]